MLGTPLLSAASVSLRYPIALTPRHKNNYFKPREAFNLLGMFQNPMMMVMVLTGVMMLGMPYIMLTLLSLVDVPCSRIELEKLGPANAGGTQESTWKDCGCSKLPAERGCQVWVCLHSDCLGSCSYQTTRLSALLAAEEESKASAASGRSPGNGTTIQQRKAARGSKRR